MRLETAGRPQKLIDLAGEAGYDDAYLELELLASEPYTRFVYGDVETAASAHRHLFSEGVGEFARPHAQVVLRPSDNAVLGAAAWLDGRELRDSRLRAAVALAKSGLFGEDDDLQRRVRLAAGCLSDPEGDDLYLSRLAVDEQARRRGVGAALLSAFEADAVLRACPRLVLEVSPAHGSARALYAGAGFQEVGSRHVSDPVTGRELRYLYMVKRVTPS